MLVSKMYRLVSVKCRLKITKLEIWVNWYLTDITDTSQYLTDIILNQYLTDVTNIL